MAAAAADASHHIATLTLEDENRRAATKVFGGPTAGRTERELETEREKEGRGSGNECLVCGTLFSSQDKLRLHAFCHTGEKPFHCSQPHCLKAFSSKYKLFRHMATHSPQKTHQCSFCEKMFHRKDHLKNHLQTHDPNKEAFKCEECGKHYNTKLGYKRHMAMHSATAGDLTCKVCLQSYESTPALLEHLKSHSGKSSGGTKEKKHPCDHCDRRFYTRKDVRRHMVVHTGRKDFLCQYCAQRFGRKDHLTRHVKKSHSQELLKIKTEPPDMLGLLGTGSPTCAVKEELSPMMCTMGPTKDSMMAKPFPGATPFPMGMYNPHHLQAMSNPAVGHHHSLVPGSLSSAMGMGCHMEPPSSLHHHHPHHHHHHHHPHHHHHSSPPPSHQQQPSSLPNQQQQHPQQPPKYQLGSTSYLLEKQLKVEMDSFLMDLQSGLPVAPPPSADPHSAASSNKEGLEPPAGLSDDLCGDPLMSKSPAVIESLCAANMDFSHLLGFLPLNLPPYSAPMSSGGLVMGYSTSSTVSSSSSSSASSHAAESHAATLTAAVPLTSLQPQPQEQPGSGGGLGLGPLHPLPPVFSSSLSATTLPRFHQAFQ
ncbi:zinc finger protein PLAGL2 [Misgurnus anguillicaudatus]|uniref:zinc finger protein PLAGL2 n=1 Tax=Misgurnus anguillicaudatus TaxID=75329 RepID=UPI002435535D|nr:zinc finger protein PLAGL2 [Misgurnus anguillicaudatus]XP_055044334.1 zinc finger protein PLAGL2 [Misgurnus anguillicaudatus]